MKTTVINLYGGPGTGKSTNAARLFTMLKDKGIEAELVTEFAKDLVWENRTFTLEDQVYVFAKQCHRLNRLMGQVSFIVTDSPILLGCVYDNSETNHLRDLVLDCHRRMNTRDFFLLRSKEYSPNGRLQTEEEAKELDREILNLLSKTGTPYCVAASNFNGCIGIMNEVLDETNEISM